MGAIINCNAVSVSSEESFGDLLQVAATLIEDRDDAAFRRNVKTSKALIKGEHVGICANRVNCRHLFRCKIKDGQFRVFLASHKCESVITIDQEAMWFATTP